MKNKLLFRPNRLVWHETPDNFGEFGNLVDYAQNAPNKAPERPNAKSARNELAETVQSPKRFIGTKMERTGGTITEVGEEVKLAGKDYVRVYLELDSESNSAYIDLNTGRELRAKNLAGHSEDRVTFIYPEDYAKNNGIEKKENGVPLRIIKTDNAVKAYFNPVTGVVSDARIVYPPVKPGKFKGFD